MTATRWAQLIRQIGHRVSIRQSYRGERCDLMIALHARRSAPSIHRFAKTHPDRPLIVALTGTDLYHDIRTSRAAQISLNLATRLVVLQRNGIDELPAAVRGKVRVIVQSAVPTKHAGGQSLWKQGAFRVAVLGHMRSEKDPMRTAAAARLLPSNSRIQIVHAGAALDPASLIRATSESIRNQRYRWIGEVSNMRARRILAASQLMVLSSRIEGGANVLSEAIVDDVPVIASNIPSTRAILGSDYPGLYPPANTRELANLLWHAETDARFYRSLKQWCGRLKSSFAPKLECTRWRQVIAELRE